MSKFMPIKLLNVSSGVQTIDEGYVMHSFRKIFKIIGPGIKSGDGFIESISSKVPAKDNVAAITTEIDGLSK